MTLLETIRDWLTREGVEFREVTHEPTYTSEDSARARGEELRHGGKALLMKVDAEYALFVLPADRRVVSGTIRRTLAARKLRFAKPEELAELTVGDGHGGLVRGSVPPFGLPILPFPLYVDASIEQNERIAFNAGSLTDSIIMAAADYLAVAAPERVFSFTTLASSTPG